MCVCVYVFLLHLPYVLQRYLIIFFMGKKEEEREGEKRREESCFLVDLHSMWGWRRSFQGHGCSLGLRGAWRVVGRNIIIALRMTLLLMARGLPFVFHSLYLKDA